MLAAIERTRPDLVLVDYMQPAALCAVEAAGVPAAALVHTLYGALDLQREAPTMGMAASIDGTNALRTDLRLPPISRFGDLLDRARVVVVVCPRQLDDEPDRLAANVRYVGPVFERIDVEPFPAPVAPRVVVSLGTTDMGEGPVVARVLEALAAAPMEVLATVGGHLDPASIARPANATVSGRIPHAAVVPGADAVVCHAGLGTIAAALRHGVPLVCVPLGRDQHANAAAVVAAGAGRVLAADAAADEIRETVTAVASAGPERDAAERLAMTLAERDRHPVVDALLAALAAP